MLLKNKYIIAIDQGTTSTRSIIYNEKLIPLTSFQKEIKQYEHKPTNSQEKNSTPKLLLITKPFIAKANISNNPIN